MVDFPYRGRVEQRALPPVEVCINPPLLADTYEPGPGPLRTGAEWRRSSAAQYNLTDASSIRNAVFPLVEWATSLIPTVDPNSAATDGVRSKDCGR